MPNYYDDDDDDNSTVLFAITGAIVCGIPLVALATAFLIKYCVNKTDADKFSRSNTFRYYQHFFHLGDFKSRKM